MIENYLWRGGEEFSIVVVLADRRTEEVPPIDGIRKFSEIIRTEIRSHILPTATSATPLR